MALGVGLNGVVGFVTELFPQQTLGWKQIAVALTGYAEAAKSKEEYLDDRETMTYSDIERYKDTGKDINVTILIRGRFLRKAFHKCGFEDDETYRLLTRLLQVGGRIARLIHHTKRLLRAKYRQENARKLRQSYHLQRDYPWLYRVFDPAIIRAINGWRGAIDTFLDALSDDTDQLIEEYQMGTRCFALYKAMDFGDKEEDRVASLFAAYNGYILLQEGAPFIKRILKSMQLRHLGLKTISVEDITEITTTALEIARINQVEKE